MAWREADAEITDLEIVITDLLTGQYANPVRVIAFNTAERWSQDVFEDAAHELRRRLYAFDLLSIDSDDLRDLPLHLRKNQLARLLRR